MLVHVSIVLFESYDEHPFDFQGDLDISLAVLSSYLTPKLRRNTGAFSVAVQCDAVCNFWRYSMVKFSGTVVIKVGLLTGSALETPVVAVN